MGRQEGQGSEPLRLGLFNVKYSANLGDGLLSECLEAGLRQACPGATVTSLDLAGRETYAEGRRFRGVALAILERSPAFARHSVVEVMLGRVLRKRLRPRWRNTLAELDAVVLGGGNLLVDADLNFPLKIDAAMTEAREARLPQAVFGVGVSDNWSARGEDLFRHSLSGPLVYASVREATSAAIWSRRLSPAGIRAAQVVHDPGVLVSDHVPARRRGGPRPLIGIGVTNPVLLRYHADEGSCSEIELTAWMAALVRRCTGRGWRVALFTNGSPEDEDYLSQIGPGLMREAPAGQVHYVNRFERPAKLAEFISGLDGLMAHRLHANIAAFSYALPHVGFSWDRKLRGFFAGVGRDHYVCTAGHDDGAEAVALMEAAMTEGIDPVIHRRVLDEARSHIHELGRALQRAVEDRRAMNPGESRCVA